MRILLCGGGTEGHIAPSLGLAQEMVKVKDEFLFVGRSGGEENKKIQQMNFPLCTISIGSPSSYAWWKKCAFAFDLYRAIKECGKIIESFRPDAVFSTGGYVSFAPVMAAAKRKIPVFLHESNAIFGNATKMLLKHSRMLFLGMPQCEGYIPSNIVTKYVGTPVRQEFYELTKQSARKKLGLKNEFMILSFGGSLGAQKLNDACMQIMKNYSSKEGMVHIHSTGKRYYASIAETYTEFVNTGGKCRAVSFIDNMHEYLTAADLVICRSGAATISELCAIGAYPIFVPSPNVKNNHQYHNATAVAKVASIPVLTEDSTLVDSIISEIKFARLHPRDCDEKRNSLRGLSVPSCSEAILNYIREALHSK